MADRRFPGIHAVLYALFDAHEALDRAAMRRQVELCLSAGVDGIVVLGLATEVAKLTEAEQRAIVSWAAEDVAGRVPLGVTVYGNSVQAQLAMLRAAEAAGAHWLILQPLSVGIYSASELLHGFGRLADSASVPVAIQNAPALMGRGLDAEGILALVARHPNITHLKGEMPVLQLAQLIAACGDRLTVLNGQGGLEMVDSLRAGCRGFVLAPDMVDHAVWIWRFWQSGRQDLAEAAYAALLPEIVFAMRSLEHLIAYGKRIFALRCGLAVHDRAPADRPSPFGLGCVGRYAAKLGAFAAGPC
jgi:4-hydroxy-tetrahydrodipicolinate synthase